MTSQPPPPAFPHTSTVSRPAPTRAGSSPARLHPDALYRPVPPVERDSDGYPHTDGAMSESIVHDNLRAYASGALRVRYTARREVLVASNLCVYFERGDRRAVVVPDAFVAFGAGTGHRLSYKVWEEGGVVPAFVLELLSVETWRRDLEAKPALYEALGVREFWVFDPLGRLPDPILGRRLDAAGRYRPVPAQPGGAYRSRVLGLDLIEGGDGFRFRDPATGETLPDLGEAIAQRDREAVARGEAERAREAEAAARRVTERDRQAEAAARAAADARVAELEELLRQSRARGNASS